MLTQHATFNSVVITPTCGSQQITDIGFESIALIYLSLISIFTLIFALRTRKVNYKNFKDTKIMILSYISVGFLAIFLGIWFILREMKKVNTIVIMLGIVDLAAPISIQCFLFVPKIVPGAYYIICKKEATFTFPTIFDTAENVHTSGHNAAQHVFHKQRTQNQSNTISGSQDPLTTQTSTDSS